VAVTVRRAFGVTGNVPIRTQFAEGLLCELESPVRIQHFVRRERRVRRMVNERSEHLLAEARVVARVHEELMPRGVDFRCRRQLLATDSAEIEIALHVGKELLRAWQIEVQLSLETCDKLGMLMCIHGFQQVWLLEGRLTMGLQGTIPFRCLATWALLGEAITSCNKGYMSFVSLVSHSFNGSIFGCKTPLS